VVSLRGTFIPDARYYEKRDSMGCPNLHG